MSLAEKTCIPCRGGVPPMNDAEINALLPELSGWEAVAGHHLHKAYAFPDFRQALDFVNRVGAIAEEQQHHPDVLLTWGKAEITIYTHKIGGLSEGDFVLAAKIDRLQN